MELKTNIEQKGKLFEGKAPEIVEDALYAAMTEAVSYLEGEVKKRTPQGVMGMSGLRGSIAGEVLRGVPVKGVVGTPFEYGEVVEKGRRAGKTMPPEGSLVLWIQKKFGVSETMAARLEYVVRRSIGKKGFEGAHMFENAFREGKPTIEGIFDRSGFKIAIELSED